MKSDLKERRNKAICARVRELCGTGLPVMQIYTNLEEEFWLNATTIRNIYNHYYHDCSN